MSRTAWRNLRVGLVVLAGLAGVLAFLSLAGSGPGFLADRQAIDVVFRDGQGIRAGSPVRVAGVDAGRVTAVDLIERDGLVRARVRLSLTTDLARRLRQDVKVTIQAGLTGQTLVNIVDAGRSGVALVPGQVVEGIETSFFDPVLEQVGLGPVERSHLSHTIAEVRTTVDAAGPRLRQIMGALHETVAQLRDTTATARPAVERAAQSVEALAGRIDAAKVEDTLARVNALVTQAEGLVTENRPVLNQTLVGVRDLTGRVRGVLDTTMPKVDTLLVGLDGTRGKADQLLGRTDGFVAQGSELLALNRANIDRSVSNVRDATDFGVRLVQKLYGNPFYLSPLYKPTRDDVRAQEMYDAAGTLLLGAKELKDALVTLQALREKPPAQMTENEKKAYQQMYERAWGLQTKLDQATQQLAEGLRTTTRR